MKTPDNDLELKIHPRDTETISFRVPVDTLESLKRIAERRDMPYQALLKLYIGQGLREDLARLFSERVLDTTTRVLSRHLKSEEVAIIIQEIQGEAVG